MRTGSVFYCAYLLNITFVAFACQSAPLAPTVVEVVPDHQTIGEPITVRIIGEGLYPKVTRQLSSKKNFLVEDEFTVRFLKQDDSETQFEMSAVPDDDLDGVIVGVTPERMVLGTYSVVVVTASDASSTPKGEAFHVVPAENDTDIVSDTNSGGAEYETDNDSQSNAENDTDTRNNGSDNNPPWEGTCRDGVMNQDELGIDCGGLVCDPCPICNNWYIGAPEPVVGLGIEGRLFSPSLTADGLTLYFAVWLSDHEEIFSATRASKDSVEFDTAVRLSINSTAYSNGTPFVVADGRSLYFYSTRTGSLGERDIMVVQRPNVNASWGTPKFVTELNSVYSEHLPRLTIDNLEIWFSSARGTGNMDWHDDYDIFRATRTDPDDPFTNIEPVESLNTLDNEGGISLTADKRTIFFTSSSMWDTSEYDVYTAQRDDVTQEFDTSAPVTTVNSTSTEADVFVSPDGTELFFASDRDGDFLLYRSTRECLNSSEQ